MSSENRIIASFSIPPEHSDRRLDQAAAELMPEHSRSRLQGWIKSGALTVNGKTCKPRDKVMLGDRLDLDAEPEAQVSWEAESIDLDIVYEDEHLLVINKPAGLVVHPAAGTLTAPWSMPCSTMPRKWRTCPEQGLCIVSTKIRPASWW